MRTIHKYPLKASYVSEEIVVPEAAVPLHVGLDPNGVPCIWMEVDTRLPMTKQAFYIVQTGQPVPDGAVRYVGTFCVNVYVWHIYLGA